MVRIAESSPLPGDRTISRFFMLLLCFVPGCINPDAKEENRKSFFRFFAGPLREHQAGVNTLFGRSGIPATFSG
jgi:hypothetical protein